MNIYRGGYEFIGALTDIGPEVYHWKAVVANAHGIVVGHLDDAIVSKVVASDPEAWTTAALESCAYYFMRAKV